MTASVKYFAIIIKLDCHNIQVRFQSCTSLLYLIDYSHILVLVAYFGSFFLSDPPCQSVFQSFEVSSFNVTLNFSWPMTESTGFATIQCPCAANPSLTNGVFATRRCGARGVWQETTYASCVSRTFQSFCVVSGYLVLFQCIQY